MLANYRKPEDLIGENGLLKQLTKMLVERALETELTQHLGHDKNTTITNDTGNARNGRSARPSQGILGNSPWTFLTTGKACSNPSCPGPDGPGDPNWRRSMARGVAQSHQCGHRCRE